MSAHNVNLRVVLSDTIRIINANRHHFLALSLLFVPLSFSATVYPSSLNPTSFISRDSRIFSSSITRVSGDEIPPVDISDSIFILVICILFQLLFCLFTTASITRSILNGFFGEPLKFTSSLKSILVSFLPLTATYIVSWLMMGLVLFSVGSLAGIMYGAILLWTETDFRGAYFLGFVVLLVVLTLGVMIYFQVEWYLTGVIVVVESKWGYAALKRSSYLVKGMRSLAFSIFVLYVFLLWIMSALFSSLVRNPFNSESVSWMLVLLTVAAYTGIATILRLYSVAATAVLFIYCKRLRGELATETAYEFVPLNFQLPHDDSEKAHKAIV